MNLILCHAFSPLKNTFYLPHIVMAKGEVLGDIAHMVTVIRISIELRYPKYLGGHKKNPRIQLMKIPKVRF